MWRKFERKRVGAYVCTKILQKCQSCKTTDTGVHLLSVQPDVTSSNPGHPSNGHHMPAGLGLLQLDWNSNTSRRKINLPANQKGYDTFETTVGKLSVRRIQIYPDYFCLGIILKVILNNFQNNA